jgi:hypothetical protein
MNDKLPGSLEPIGGAHTSNQVTASGSADAQKTDQVEHGELVDDAKLSAGNLRIHNQEDVVVNNVQDEAVLKQELISASAEIKAQDINATRHMMNGRQPKGLRIFSYLFLPTLLIDMFFVWKNAESIRRLQKASKSYENYHKLVEQKIDTILDEKFIKMALSDIGKRKLESGSTPLLERVLIARLRKYPVPLNSSTPGDFYREEILMDLMSASQSSTVRARKALIDSVIQEYLDKNIRIENGLKYRAKLVAVSDFCVNREDFSPLIETSLVQGDGSSQKRIQELKLKLGNLIQERSARVFETGIKALKSEAGTLGGDIAGIIQEPGKTS